MRVLIVQSLVILIAAMVADSQISPNQPTQRQRQLIPYAKSWGRILGPRVVLPDSLGGKRLIGYVSMEVSVTKDGGVHGYKVGRIEVSPDTTNWFVYSPFTRTQRGDSLFVRFTPWLENYFHNLSAVGTGTDSLFLIQDTVWYSHSIRFGSLARKPHRQ